MVHIKTIENIDINEWRSYVNRCPYATFFHTPEWYLIWEKYLGYTISCLKFNFVSGNTAIFPFSIEKRLKGLVKRVISSPVGTYGGILSNTQLSKNECDEVLFHLLSYKNIQIRVNPLSPFLINLPYEREDFTQIIELKYDEADLLKLWSINHLRSVKKAHKSSVKVTEATEGDWDDYYRMYIESTKRWNRKVKNHYRKELFTYLKDLSKKQCRLWIAKVDQKNVAGAICFYHNKHAVYWHGAARKEYFNHRPVHLLMKSIIENASQKELEWFDFNPSSGLAGVIKFKKGFGSKKINANLVEKESCIFAILEKCSKIL